MFLGGLWDEDTNAVLLTASTAQFDVPFFNSPEHEVVKHEVSVIRGNQSQSTMPKREQVHNLLLSSPTASQQPSQLL